MIFHDEVEFNVKEETEVEEPVKFIVDFVDSDLNGHTLLR